MPTSDNRSIRVFISSTFLDMQEERDVLVKKISPQLRKLCEQRAVTWTDVDLRWGITDEQTSEGKVLPLCLEEIQRCRPFFIGLLGERYGSLPSEIPAELLERQPWLGDHRDKSITALEIIYGVLAERQMNGHAYFYFRDPRFVESATPESRKDFLSENTASAEKLEQLKNEIRIARDGQVCELRENYGTPAELGNWILEDLTRLIERLYPQPQVPSWLEQETGRHEAYARSRSLGFIGREDLLHRLDRYCGSPGKPLALTGESGSGKSSLLAEWVARWRQQHPDDLVIQHYVGSTTDSAGWGQLVRRVLEELKVAFSLPDEVPTSEAPLISALGTWVSECAGGRRVVLVLDALDQLADNETSSLGWLPPAFPTNFKVIVSAMEGSSLAELRQRQWTLWEVPLFGPAEVTAAVSAFYEPFGRKQLPSQTLELVANAPAARNPLYLRAVLDELRQFGDHGALQATAAAYLSCASLAALFDKIIARWDRDFGQEPAHPEAVRRSLSLMACARLGLSEKEMLDLLGSQGVPMPRFAWTPLYLAVENFLVNRGGLLNLGHEHLRNAVRNRWLADEQAGISFRRQLVDYFRKGSNTNRSLDEVPTLLRELEDWEGLKAFLTDIPTFMRMRGATRWKWELHDLWRSLRLHHDPGHSMTEAVSTFERSGQSAVPLPQALSEVGRFLHETSDCAAAEPFMRRAIALMESKGPPTQELAAALTDLGTLLLASGRVEESFSVQMMALQASAQVVQPGDLGPFTRVAGPMATALKAVGNQFGAQLMLKHALTSEEHRLGAQDPRLAKALTDLAVFLLDGTGRLDEAESLLRRATELLENHGMEHWAQYAVSLRALGEVMRSRKKPEEAEPLIRKAMGLDEKLFGADHPKVAADLCRMSQVLRETGRPREAEQAIVRSIRILRPFGGEDYASSLSEQGQCLLQAGKQVEAEAAFREALAINERIYGAQHPKIAVYLDKLVSSVSDVLRGEAEALEQRAVTILLNYSLDTEEKHPCIDAILTNYAALLKKNGCSDSEILSRIRGLQLSCELAHEPKMRHSVEMFSKAGDQWRPQYERALNRLAELLASSGRAEESEPFLRQALAVAEACHGQDHPRVAATLANLGHVLMARRQVTEAEIVLQRAFRIVYQRRLVDAVDERQFREIFDSYATVLEATGLKREGVEARIQTMCEAWKSGQKTPVQNTAADAAVENESVFQQVLELGERGQVLPTCSSQLFQEMVAGNRIAGMETQPTPWLCLKALDACYLAVQEVMSAYYSQHDRGQRCDMEIAGLFSYMLLLCKCEARVVAEVATMPAAPNEQTFGYGNSERMTARANAQAQLLVGALQTTLCDDAFTLEARQRLMSHIKEELPVIVEAIGGDQLKQALVQLIASLARTAKDKSIALAMKELAGMLSGVKERERLLGRVASWWNGRRVRALRR